MNKNRLEAFSDGVIAIIITIMVLELKVPEGNDLHSLLELMPKFISYVLSFVFVAIYWGNHHHLLHTVHHVNSKIIWANIHLLFWLSLIPFATAWMGETSSSNYPVAVYALLMTLCGVAYYILQITIQKHYTHSSELIRALKKQEKKGVISLVLYLLSIITAMFYPVISQIIFVIVAIVWFVPDKNLEKALSESK